MEMDEIMTPALVADLDAVEFNLRTMAEFFEGKPAKLRPHFKNHRVLQLADRQLAAGAAGLTCATLREAEILAGHGVEDILIANELVGEEKARKLAELASLPSVKSIKVAIDSRKGASDLARAARNKTGSQGKLAALIDIDIGLGRCGVAPGGPALELARHAAEEGLAIEGVMGYDGHLQAQPPSAERDEVVRRGSQALVDSAGLIRAAGILAPGALAPMVAPIVAPIVSTGGTGTYYVSGAYPGVTEIQAGSYLLMDTQYVTRGSVFHPSLTVLATVVSTRGSSHAVIDCGVKSISGERGLSEVKGLAGVKLKALHAEHGILEVAPDAGVRLSVGQKIELWVHYSDATVNLHSTLFGVRNGRVEEAYHIEH